MRFPRRAGICIPGKTFRVNVIPANDILVGTGFYMREAEKFLWTEEKRFVIHFFVHNGSTA
jgi:hypothetical protein